MTTEKRGIGSLLGWIFQDGKRGFVAGAMAALIGASAIMLASGGARSAEGFSTDPDRARIERVVRDYILANPEIIPEAVTLLQNKEMAKAIEANRKQLETPFGSAWAGAEDGDVVLVEFFDYACPYCQSTRPDVERLLKEDPRLKVVWRELPVLGEDSVAAAHVSLAAARQGRFKAFYDRLFGAGRPSKEAVARAQKAAGVTPMKDPEFDREIEKNYELARAISATGTPVFVIGDKILHGAVGYDALKEAVAEARK